MLLNQFHDILPGSSIGLVYEDAKRQYEQVAGEGTELLENARRSVLSHLEADEESREFAVLNTTGYNRAEVVIDAKGSLRWASAPALGVGSTGGTHHAVVSQKNRGGGFILENSHLRAELRADGTITSLLYKDTEREALAGPGNQFLLYQDEPTAWAAWDVDPQHMETEQVCPGAKTARLTLETDLRAEVTFTRSIGDKSSMTQVVRLDADARRLEFHCKVDWRERNRMLKVAFPLNVRAMNATYEMQFGAAERPTHFNTRYDLARYEVPGHRWADLSEHGFGVALLSESKYGWSAFGNTLRLSLLRSPGHPDPECDQGAHEFAYAIMPHTGNWQEGGVVAEGLAFNIPLHVTERPAPVHSMSLLSLSGDDQSGNLVIDTVKKAESSDDLVVRLYECHGARGTATLQVNEPFEQAYLCNLLEDEETPLRVKGDSIRLDYTPYKILTLKPVSIIGTGAQRPKLALQSNAAVAGQSDGLVVILPAGTTTATVALKNLVLLPSRTNTPTMRGLRTGSANMFLHLEDILIAPNNGSDEPAAVDGLTQVDVSAATHFGDDGMFLGSANGIEEAGLEALFRNVVVTHMRGASVNADGILLSNAGTTAFRRYRFEDGCVISFSKRAGTQLNGDVIIEAPNRRMLILGNGLHGLWFPAAAPTTRQLNGVNVINNGQMGLFVQNIGINVSMSLSNSLIIGSTLHNIDFTVAEAGSLSAIFANMTIARQGAAGSLTAVPFRIGSGVTSNIVLLDCIIAGNGGAQAANAVQHEGTSILTLLGTALVTEGPFALANPPRTGSGAFLGEPTRTADPQFVDTINFNSNSYFDVNNPAYASANSIGGPLGGGADYVGPNTSVDGWSLY